MYLPFKNIKVTGEKQILLLLLQLLVLVVELLLL